MREIKFRAWDKERLEMYYPSTEDNYAITLSGIPIWFHPAEGTDEKEKFIIMQYTGFKDKNGKEIYEGDVVEISHEYASRLNWTIIWKDTGFVLYNGLNSFRNIETYYIDIEKDNDEYLFYHKNFTVVGNIYETPELTGE
jgi:uncharacterized phage protein (TIGR01671 family)